LSDDCGTTWERMAAYGDDGTGSFATAAKYDGDDLWIPQVNTDWCGLGYGSDCYSINLNNYTGKSNVLVAFESFNSFGNPLYIDDVTISQFVGIEKKPENDSFTIYPNPATGHLTIEMNGDHAFSGLVILNQLGQTVYMQQNLKDNVINLSTEGWTKGVYFVRLEGNTGTKTRKVVVY